MKIKVIQKPSQHQVPVMVVHKCNSWARQADCKNPECSWFNHAMSGMGGGDYPPGYDGSLDR